MQNPSSNLRKSIHSISSKVEFYLVEGWYPEKRTSKSPCLSSLCKFADLNSDNWELAH
jgi:hypothetical protein